jgi:tRNA nucleotidyltransferase (CCA-adding enzyme)
MISSERHRIASYISAENLRIFIDRLRAEAGKEKAEADPEGYAEESPVGYREDLEISPELNNKIDLARAYLIRLVPYLKGERNIPQYTVKWMLDIIKSVPFKGVEWRTELNDLIKSVEERLSRRNTFSNVHSIDELLKVAMEITPEMEDHFNKKLKRHIGFVQKFCNKIYDYDSKRFSGIVELGKEHDKSKFNGEERIPYIILAWKRKKDDFDSYTDPATRDEDSDHDAINLATEKHIKANKHHPEHWTDQKENLINEHNRDEAPDKIIDATKMPDLYIGEMIADWCALSAELGESTPKKWADDNVNIRWKFTDTQKDLIYELIDAIWDEKEKEAQLLEEFLKIASVEKLPLDIPISNTLKQILEAFQSKGLKGLIVGGSVRDALLGLSPKDVDIEVYGVELENLLELLGNFGKAHIEGKSFGVIKLRDAEGNDYDFSIPRRDSKSESDPTNIKGRGITVKLDKDMPVNEAASRRDYTINSMAYDPLTQELHDYFGGLSDLQNKTLKATGPAFLEDPLRVLRGMQFAARFGMTIDPQTAEMCKSIKHMPLQKDRVRDEFMKFFTKCKEPSKGLQFLIDTEWIDNYPELKGIIGVEQEPEYHPEGSVERHTAYTLDAASRIADEGGFAEEEKAILIASALCHDLGKASTTAVTEGRITSYGHHEEGAKLTKSFLNNIGIGRDVTEPVTALVGEHMSHLFFDPKSRKSTVMHLAERLNKATIKQLEAVIQSDMAGRPPLPTELPESAKVMLDLAKEKGVYEGKAQPLISGKDLMEISPAVHQGKALGQILQEVKQKQLEGTLKTKEEALDYAKKLLPKYYSFIKGGDVLTIIGGQGGPIVGEILQNAWNAQMTGEIKNREEALQWVQEKYRSSDAITEAQILEEFIKIAEKEGGLSFNVLLSKAIELHNTADTLREKVMNYASEHQFGDPKYMYDKKLVQRHVHAVQELFSFWNDNIDTIKKEMNANAQVNDILDLRYKNTMRYMELALKNIDRDVAANHLENASLFADNAQNEIHNAIKVFLRLEQEEVALSKPDEDAIRAEKLRQQTAEIKFLEEFLKFAEV